MAENKTTFKQNVINDLRENPLSTVVRTSFQICKRNLHQRTVSFVSSLVLGAAVAKFYYVPMIDGFVVAPIMMMIRDANKKALQNIRDAKQK